MEPEPTETKPEEVEKPVVEKEPVEVIQAEEKVEVVEKVDSKVNGVVEKAAERLTIEIPNGEGRFFFKSCISNLIIIVNLVCT